MDTTSLEIETDTLLALAAMFLGLALVVQVVQEIWKYLTSSKSRIYHMVLRDSFGPWIEQLYGNGPVARFQVRGPFQWGWLPSRPTGKLLPLSKDELLEAMDSLATGWIGSTLETLKAEARLQGGTPATPSPAFDRLLGQLAEEAEVAGHHSDARRMLEFLTEWMKPKVASHQPPDAAPPIFDARRVLTGMYQEFFPDRLRTEREFGQLARNFEHVNGRRNLRYSFSFGLLLALFLNLPFQTLWRQASALSPEQAIALAEEMQRLRQAVEEQEPLEGRNVAVVSEAEGGGVSGNSVAEPPPEEGATGSAAAATGERREPHEDMTAAREGIASRLALLEQILLRFDSNKAGEEKTLLLRGWRHLDRVWDRSSDTKLSDSLAYLLGCLVTALFLTFGAPFWDRLVDALLRVQPRSKPATAAAREEV